MRFRDRSSSVTFLLMLLCISSVFQILGSPISFYDLSGSQDAIASYLLEGFATPTWSELSVLRTYCSTLSEISECIGTRCEWG
jgi:hypothetical protein